MVYRVCPDCGAYLVPSERCDCQNKEKAAPVLEHRSGQMENGLPTNFSIAILHNFVNDFKIQSQEDVA